MKRINAVILSFVLFISCASLAEAHAFLDTAEPAVGGTAHQSPTVVKLWFTRHLKSGDSTVQVFNSAKKEVDKRDAKLDADDPNLLVISVPKLPSGTYTVIWTAVCIDGHTTHGSFEFDVDGP